MVLRTTYQDELNKLNREVVEMGALATEMVSQGMQAFLRGDETIREELARMDREIYRREQEIDRHCFEIIALHQPVASDLRKVSSCLKVVTDMNRIGRYGRNIAEMGEGTAGHSVTRRFPLQTMAQQVLSMVEAATSAFVSLDPKGAMAILERDDEIDKLWESIFRGTITCMIEQPQNISDGAYAILVARYLERIADHACNIGERVVFMVTGTRVDHYESKRVPRLDYKEGPMRPEPSTDGYYVTRLDEK